MTDFDDVKDPGRTQRVSAKDKVNLLSLTKGAWTPVRFVGGLTAYGRYWIQSKNKDGKAIRYSIPCPSFDPKTQERDSTIADPWRDAEAVLRAQAEANGANKKGKGKDDKKQQLAISFSVEYYANVIDRKTQKRFNYEDNRPTKAEIKAGFKLKDADTATPMFAMRLSRSLASKVKGLKALNVDENDESGTAYPVNHPKYGVDVRILYDDTKAPADQYQVIPREQRSPLKRQERELLLWNLDGLESELSEAEHIAEFKRWAKINEFDLSEIGLDEKPTKGRKSSKARDEDDEDDFDDEDDDDAPKSKKTSAKSKKKPVDDDEDDEDDDDDDFDDEDDEDDEPPAKSKKAPAKKAPVKGKKKPVDDEDDEDEDDDDFDDEDDEDDEPPAKSKKAPAKSKKKPVDEDDDDDFDDEDDDEDDEDDEPPAKSKKAPPKKAPPAKSKKKPIDDDDDDDDFDDDDDEDDEDDEPPAKSKKAPAKKAPAKKAPAKSKKKPVDDDDDDDFDDDDEDDDD